MSKEVKVDKIPLSVLIDLGQEMRDNGWTVEEVHYNRLSGTYWFIWCSPYNKEQVYESDSDMVPPYLAIQEELKRGKSDEQLINQS